MLAISYNWWKFLHVAGVIAFVMFHGVSMIVAFRLRKERDRGKIAAMTQLSGSSVTAMYISLVWLIVFGVIAGIQGDWWNDGWFWIAIGLLVVVSAEMGGGEDQPVPRDRLEHQPRLREELAGVVGDLDRLDREARQGRGAVHAAENPAL